MRKLIHSIALPVAILAIWFAPSASAQLMDVAAVSRDHDHGIAQIANVTAGQALQGAAVAEFGHSQVAIITDTPEPRTAAVILCALFVAALVARHLYQRRVCAARPPAA